jgi:hypothetical protein
MGKLFLPTPFSIGRIAISQQATRWDNYLHILDPHIHWFSLINSLVNIMFLCAMVSMIVYHSISRDVRPSITSISVRFNVTHLQISQYNAINLSICTSSFPPQIVVHSQHDSHDDTLDFLWQVQLSFACAMVYKSHGAMQCFRLCFKQGLCNAWRHQ